MPATRSPERSYFDKSEEFWLRKLGVSKPEFWVLTRNEHGDAERIASTSDMNLAVEIIRMLENEQ